MDILSHCVALLKRLDESWLYAGPRAVLDSTLRSLLTSHPLVIADVGATGQLESRWLSIRSFLRALTFEPRPEAGISGKGTVAFPLALAEREGVRTLYLARDPESSSLYRLNDERMRDFATHAWYCVVGELSVPVARLDDSLTGDSRDAPHFLKLDVEGAELDVLRGAAAALASSVLGLRVEVNFVQRHLEAPRFAEVEGYLRERGFELFILSRQLVLRRNRLHAPFSQPQLVWGDGVFVLTRPAFLERLAATRVEERDALAARFVVLLLCHNIHDFALEIVEAVRDRDLASRAVVDHLASTVVRSMPSRWRLPVKLLTGAALAAAIRLGSWPVPRARLHAKYYLKRRAGLLFYYGWRCCARGGAEDATVSDDLT